LTSLAHFDKSDTRTHAQVVNHWPQSSVELGAKVGMHRNLRALSWFDNISMDAFFPRM